jgi:psiF repeat
MTPRGAALLHRWVIPGALLIMAAASVLCLQGARADTTHPVTATPPLQVVPASTTSKNVQQRMRACNASADARKLQNSARETFIKSCMAAHRSRSTSRPGSQPKPYP